MAIPSKGRMAEDTLQLLKVLFHALMAVLPWTCGLALCPDAKKATVLCAGLPAKRVQAQPAAVHSHHLAGVLQASACFLRMPFGACPPFVSYTASRPVVDFFQVANCRIVPRLPLSQFLLCRSL